MKIYIQINFKINIMKNILLEYMSRRSQIAKADFSNVPGPVITLSREYGCYASEIARLLAEKLSDINHEKKIELNWQVVSKEVIEESAKHLEVDKEEIAHIFAANEKTFLADLIVSFSNKKYMSDSLIKKTISNVVKTYGNQGYTIIVGRAGCTLCSDIDKALHVRLVAPLSWRVEQIRNRFKKSKVEAEKQVQEFDQKREKFMKYFKGDKPACEMFDVFYNRARLSSNDIVDSIIQLATLKKLY